MLLRSGLTMVLAAFTLFGSALAVPLTDKLKRLSPGARDVLKRSTPAAPRFVVYSDAWSNSLPTASAIQGFNVYALAFWTLNGAVDMAMGWQQLSDSQRTSYVQEYNAAGISLIVSAFGSTDTPTSSGADPVNTANNLSSWVQKYGLQGVDIDYEDFAAFHDSGAAEQWLVTLTQQLRQQLPQERYILSHAPVAPWFSPSMWSGGGYLKINQAVGSMIDWYNVQFYNQGTSEYTTCSGLLNNSSSKWPQSALFQIIASGVSQDKLLIGKPAMSSDASSGYMDPATLASCVSQAHASGWSAGVMTWEWPQATAGWLKQVVGNTF